MACTPVTTGQRFVSQAIAHIDCQAQSIGAYGYGALSDPGSSLALALTGLLTIFVAWFGLRLLMGEPLGRRDVVGDILRVGIVLALATSWPAWRTLGYDVVMKGPGELVTVIGGASDLPGAANDLTARLQSVDDGIVLLTIQGTGRNVGGTNRSDSIGDSFRGIALTDQEGLSDGRIAFLTGVLGPLALVRIGAGLLLALAPLMAGLLLFAGTRDLFVGWLRALAALTLSSLALSVVYGVELAVLEPWLRDALALRNARVLTPSAPTELVVITSALAIAAFGMLFLIARIAFFGGFGLPRMVISWPGAAVQPAPVVGPRLSSDAANDPPSRAFAVAEAVTHSMRREEGSGRTGRVAEATSLNRSDERSPAPHSSPQFEPVGSSYRSTSSRRFRRSSVAGEKRDNKT